MHVNSVTELQRQRNPILNPLNVDKHYDQVLREVPEGYKSIMRQAPINYRPKE
jgi:hypothetical protein